MECEAAQAGWAMADYLRAIRAQSEDGLTDQQKAWREVSERSVMLRLAASSGCGAERAGDSRAQDPSSPE